MSLQGISSNGPKRTLSRPWVAGESCFKSANTALVSESQPWISEHFFSFNSIAMYFHQIQQIIQNFSRFEMCKNTIKRRSYK